MFQKFADYVSDKSGKPWAFIAALTLILGWILTGPLAGFNDTWQLVINTTTTIVTFLMVFLIQSTQNRDAQSVHLKLDELLLAIKEADNEVLNAEDFDESKLKRKIKSAKRKKKSDA